MTPKQIYEALVSDGYLSSDPEDLCAEAERQADFEHNSYWVRALLYGLVQLVDEHTFLLDDTEDELYVGMDPETYARWENAHQDDGIDVDPETQEVVA